MDSSTDLAFIPGKLDDFGLPASVFRVYCHIARRAGSDGTCYASLGTMATTCRLNIKTVQGSIADLRERGMISKDYRHGRPSIYRLMPSSQWQPYPKEDHAQSDTIPNRIPRGIPKRGVNHHTQSDTYKGTPTKLPHEVTPNMEGLTDILNPESSTGSQSKPSPKRQTFTKPTLDDVKAYAIEIRLPTTEADDFYDYYESNGWRVGGKGSMKDWKASARRWKRNWEKKTGSHTKPNTDYSGGF